MEEMKKSAEGWNPTSGRKTNTYRKNNTTESAEKSRDLLFENAAITRMLFDICADYGITVKRADSGKIGNAMVINDKPYIIIGNSNDLVQLSDRQYTVAHELGHIMLGHLTNRVGLSSQTCEIEAGIFASVLMAGAMLHSYYNSKEDVSC